MTIWEIMLHKYLYYSLFFFQYLYYELYKVYNGVKKLITLRKQIIRTFARI